MDQSDSPHPSQPDRERGRNRPYMLAVFDVLGFSARLERDGLENVVRMYRDLIDRAVLIEAMRCLGARPIGDGTRVPVLFALPVEYAYFSDTILLWVPLEPLFAAPFISRCAALICEALKLGVPLRGAIALGHAVLDKETKTFIGEPLVEAARLEAAQGWLGATFAPSATWPPFLAEVEPKFLLEYAIPIKDGMDRYASPVALDWPRKWRETANLPSLVDVLSSMSQTHPHPYYDAASAFVRHSEANHDWFSHPEKLPSDAKLRIRPWQEVEDEYKKETSST